MIPYSGECSQPRRLGDIDIVMAQFLTRKGIVYHLDRIIEEANRELVLISPYIKADKETKNLLKNKTRATTIHVIYGKKELKPAEQSFLDSLGIATTFLKNLHAKCYLNENEALLTSMNLYQFSQEHNDEMGILVSRQDDAELYKSIHGQAMMWKTAEREFEPAIRKEGVTATGTRTTPSQTSVRKKPMTGFCIRCKEELTANPERPYCKRCYKSWEQFNNSSYKETYCHTCGKKHKTTRIKPLCISCFAKYKAIFTFAAS